MPDDFHPVDVNPTQPPHQMNESKQSVTTQSFTEQTILLFQRRFEEGYDLYDPLYQKWLEQEHPEVATFYNSESSHSILDLFPEAPIVNPVEIIDDSSNTGKSTKSDQPSVSNLLTSTETIKSLTGTSNLPVNTQAMSNTQSTNSLSV